MPTLAQLGWAEPFESAFVTTDDPQLQPARISAVHSGAYLLLSEQGTQPATVAGRLRHETTAASDLPAVGDWVAARCATAGPAVIERILPRRTALMRLRPAAMAEPQIIATNLDTVFVVTALNQDFNPRRLERYLALVWESGAQPVVLLAKADLTQTLPAQEHMTAEVAAGAPVHAISCLSGQGLDALSAYQTPGRTLALIGSSGAGKSTLANTLLQADVAATAEIRLADGRGRHTTSRRELFILPSGALLIDTPGMREVGLWDAQGGVQHAFDDVEAFTAQCRFGDCTHTREPGCGVRAALARGELDQARYRSYLKLLRELAHVQRQQDERARRKHTEQMQREFKARNRSLRRHPKR